MAWRASLVVALACLSCSASSGSDSGTGGSASGGSGNAASGGTGAGGQSGVGGASGSSGAGGQTTAGKVGDPCTDSSQCTDPPNAECYTTIGGNGFPEITFPGGYCSKPCGPATRDPGTGEEDNDCGTAGGCTSGSFSGGSGSISLSLCTSGCTKPEDCRTAEGYTCVMPLPGFGYCAPP